MRNILFICLVFFVSDVFSQTSKRIYIVPVITDCNIRPGVRRAKYFCDSLHTVEQGIRSQWMPLGREPYMVVAASVTQQQHDSLAAKNDVAAFPVNIDATLTAGAVTQIKNALENRKLPGDWVSTSFTYRQVLKRIMGMAQFLQRFGRVNRGELFGTGITLETRFSQLPPATRNALISTAQDMSFDNSTLSGISTLRTILKEMFNQWNVTRGDIIFGGETF